MRLLEKKYCTYPHPGFKKKKIMRNQNVHSVNPLLYKNSVTIFQTMNINNTFETTHGK
jgi:hypothetical protein